jgi:hypothetical protein
MCTGNVLFFIYTISVTDCIWLLLPFCTTFFQVGLLHSITSFWGWSAMKLIVVLPYLDACDFYPVRNYCCFYVLWYSWVFLKLCFLTGGHSITSFLAESSVPQQGRRLWSVHPSESRVLRKLSYTTTHRNSNSYARGKNHKHLGTAILLLASLLINLRKKLWNVDQPEKMSCIRAATAICSQ